MNTTHTPVTGAVKWLVAKLGRAGYQNVTVRYEGATPNAWMVLEGDRVRVVIRDPQVFHVEVLFLDHTGRYAYPVWKASFEDAPASLVESTITEAERMI